ncbi:pyridoxal-dependent decarboxylase, exosortase A system-associated [Paraglaciecola psychrophila]|uniref:Orn/DAP/Arg decarboxylase 2 n=1 Tax=Paraglaciecola psychrophila 170 TaxID=1129794 RepID=K7AZ92_9ALTE|nr:pyridoxal-dependent decarboxylase, exosortase A system-associated [Paraglaciecola psychrophila]AGH44226.1 Orn/DAP/Arg decarboxylase 2 [Paraglaciecola psychrophila 170]GAC40380.1 diaminopimelate decarboxylase [Paraglaciecola psychrophila 170]
MLSINKKDNQLVFAGKTPSDLEHIAGGTPCYIYDRNQIKNNIIALKTLLPKKIKLHYAIKANPMPNLVAHAANYLDGLDVASHQELLTALSTGIEPGKVSIAGPGKTEKSLLAAIISGVVINVESKTELIRIQKIASLHKKQANVAFRINPDFELKGAAMKMSGGPKQFGIDAEVFAETFSMVNEQSINFVGFHIFSGSQNLSVDALLESYRKALELAFVLSEQINVLPKQINIGGGIGVSYHSDQVPVDIKRLCLGLHELLDELATKLVDTEVHLELGRFLVANAGMYLCKIVDIKESRGKTFWVCDGGMHHHLANSGNLGQVFRKNHPVFLANCIDSTLTQHVDIVGPLCTPLDIIASNISLPMSEIGGYVAVMLSGAYGASASPQGFLSQGEALEMLI